MFLRSIMRLVEIGESRTSLKIQPTTKKTSKRAVTELVAYY
jgi:hypothetical protein